MNLYTRQVMRRSFRGRGNGHGKTLTFINLGDITRWEDGRCTLHNVLLYRRHRVCALELSKEEAVGFNKLMDQNAGKEVSHHVTLDIWTGIHTWTLGAETRINAQNVHLFLK